MQSNEIALPAKTNAELLSAANGGEFEFLDFGCSRGGSMKLAQNLFGGGAGLGIDLDPIKVAETRAAGFQAIEANVTNLPLRRDSVRYVMISHFLEHLPGLKTAEQALFSAIGAAREFVFVTQPWFDSDGYLFRNRLKLYWSDWHGHPNRMTSLDFHYVLAAAKRKKLIDGFRIFGIDAILDSKHDAIHPLESDRDQSKYDASVHPPKQPMTTVFSSPVYKEIQVLIDIKSSTRPRGHEKKYSKAVCLFSSYD